MPHAPGPASGGVARRNGHRSPSVLSSPAMAKKKKDEAAAGPSTASLVGVTAVGVVSALWALFQWAELVVVRAGGTAFCAVSERLDCNAVWNAPFAKQVHRTTGLPVAGWGLVWSLAIVVLGLWALYRRGERKPLGDLPTALRIATWVGVVVSLGLAAVSLHVGALCLGCLGTYFLVAILAGLTLFGWKGEGFPAAKPAALRLVLVTAAVYLLLLWPGLKTPGDPVDEASEAALAAMKASANAAGRDGDAAASASPSDVGDGSPDAAPPAPFATGAPTGDPERDRRIVEFIENLPPVHRQLLSDGLMAFHSAPEQALPPPRVVEGPADAPVRIVDFTDIRCPHCRKLHEDLTHLREQAGEMFSIDSRQFPLDSTCNVKLPLPPKDGVSCLAARARICMEGDPKAWAFARALFESQRELTEEKVFEIASQFTDVERLKRCIASEETEKKLQDDIALAWRLGIQGTPLVFVDGRRAPSFSGLLYVLILNEGRSTHPAFAKLPPPSLSAHMH